MSWQGRLARLRQNTIISDYLIPFLMLLAIASVFLYRATFLGEVLLPADLLNASRLPWVHYFDPQKILAGRPLNPELGDSVLIGFPIRKFVTNAVLSKDIPFWNPYSFCGYSFEQRAATQIFNPIEALYYALPTNIALNLTLILELVLAGYFAFLLARSLGAGKVPAYLAAIAMMFNANSVLWLEFFSHLKGEMFIPIITMFFYRGLNQRNLCDIGVASLLLGLQINSGIPQTAQYTMMFLGVIALAEALRASFKRKTVIGMTQSPHASPQDRVRQASYPIFSLAICLAIAMLIGAVFLWPFYRSLSDSIRAEQNRALTEELKLSLAYFASFLFPKLFYELKTATRMLGNMTELLRYSGIVTLLLAPLGIFYKKHRSFAASLAIFAGFSVLVSASLTAKETFVKAMPILKFGNLTRIMSFLPFCLAILAGLGLQALGDIRKSDKRTKAAALSTFVAWSTMWATIGAYGLRATGHRAVSTLLDANVSVPAAVFLLTLVLTITSMHHKQGRKKEKAELKPKTPWAARSTAKEAASATLGVILSLLLVGELFFFGININMTTPPKRVFPTTPGIEALTSQSHQFRTITIGNVLPANTFWIYEIQSAEGYDPLLPKDYALLINSAKGAGRTSTNGKVSISAPYMKLLNITNVEYVLSDSFIVPTGPIFEEFDPSKNLAYGDQSAVVKTVWNFQEHNIPVIETSPRSKIVVEQRIPENSVLEFFISTDPDGWSPSQGGKAGSGIDFKVCVADGNKTDVIFEKTLDPASRAEDRRWFHERVDLSKYANRTVNLVFVTAPTSSGVDKESESAGEPDQASSASKGNSQKRFQKPAWGNPRVLPFDNVDPLVLIYDKDMKIYRNLTVLPRAAVYYNTKVESDEEGAFDTIFEKDFDIEKEVLLQSGKEISGGSPMPQATPATILKYSPTRVEIQAEAKKEGYLVLLDGYGRSWSAFVDGKKEEIVKAFGCFRGVHLDPGSHRIVFKYTPRDFLAALPFAIVGIVLSMTLIIKGRKWNF